jgi:GNAT superfamily N-acetyltransferase
MRPSAGWRAADLAARYGSIPVTTQEDAAVQACSRALFGHPLPPHAYAALVGALPGAVVTVRAVGDMLHLTLVGADGAYTATRQLGSGPSGPELRQVRFDVVADRQGQGLGTRVFARQVEAAALLGVSRMTAHATRSATEIGYYVWPRLGYDFDWGPLSRHQRQVNRRAQELISDRYGTMGFSYLFAQPNGAAWWRDAGVEVYLAFRMAGDDRVRLNAYLARRGDGSRPRLRCS